MLLLPPDQQHQSTEGNQFALILGGYRTMCKINLWSTFSRNEFHLLYFYYFVCLLQYAGRTIVTGMEKNLALHHLCLNRYFPGEPGSADLLCLLRRPVLWPGGVMVRTLDSQLEGSRFDSWLFHFNLRQVVHTRHQAV